jgi:hypothetical protein
VFKPGVYSDFDGTLSHADWQWFGHALLTYEVSETLYLKGGVEVSEVFDDFGAYPLLGLSVLFHSKWRTDLLLPRRAELSFLPSTATTISAGLSLDGQEYRARTSVAFGENEFDVRVQELVLYLGLAHRLNDHLSLYGKIGALLAGDNEFENPVGVNVDGQAEVAPMAEVGFGWDF